MPATKICFIGNSHLGALAQSEVGNTAFAAAGYDVVYWGAPGSLFRQIREENGHLISSSVKRSLVISGGRYTHLPLAEFDTLVFYGCHVTLGPVAIRIGKQLKTVHSLSSGFWNAIIAEQIDAWWEEQQARSLIESAIRAHPGQTYVFAPQPNRAEDPDYRQKAKVLADSITVNKAITGHLHRWCSERGILFCSQPPDTLIKNGLFTRAEFGVGSIKMEARTQHDIDDRTHMNAAYGDRILAEILAILATKARKPE